MSAVDQQPLGNGEENSGIPDDLRCKRSDGKQWRCTAMSMPDKTVCEKHYVQAKKRAANSAMRASLKKAKRKSLGESDNYLESKSDDIDTPVLNTRTGDYSVSGSGKRLRTETSKSLEYSPETPMSTKNSSLRNTIKMNYDLLRDDGQFEDSWRPNKSSSVSNMESSRNRLQRSLDASALMEYSDGSTDSSEEDIGGQTCHQCRRNDRDKVIWCLRCDRRGYCISCISARYSDIPLEEIEKVCPACRGSCDCKVCLRGDNMVKVKIREIPILDKLQYLYRLLSSVLPIVKAIHHEQCSEVELEKRLRGAEIDLVRAKLNADEQMCCNICRIPVIDYHRHCANCSYDLCLGCCRTIREASSADIEGELREDQDGWRSQEIQKEIVMGGVNAAKLNIKFSEQFPGWRAKLDGSIPCPPKEFGGCGYPSLNLGRIFKMNWVAKLVKNAEEMVSGCKVSDNCNSTNYALNDARFCQYAHREGIDDNFLYCPSSEEVSIEGISNFTKHWARGQPVIVKQICDASSISSWDPKVIWKGIRETADEKGKEENRTVKAINCLDWSEVDIKLGDFIKGYSEGRHCEDGLPEMLRLKDWPSPSASEEFLLYQRPEFISKLPLLEYIHSRLGLLNVAAKLPHYSLQNDAGPKIYISYGSCQELGRGDSVTSLHFNMRDMVYLLVHTCEVKHKGSPGTKFEDMQISPRQSEVNDSILDPERKFDEERLPDLLLVGPDRQSELESKSAEDEDEKMYDQQQMEPACNAEEENISSVELNGDGGDISEKALPGSHWDVFRRVDVPSLIEYLRVHRKDFEKPGSRINDKATHPLYEEGLYLNEYHKKNLKDEFGVEPWSFDQNLGQAIFIPAGCPFQVRNLQSNVQLGVDFLFPESMGEAVRLAEDIRWLPNNHEAKLQILEVGKIALYAASSAIKEVQKLVLEPKLGAVLGFEDPNLTARVSDNLERIEKQAQISFA